jgi:homoserine O-acetyltransferase
MVKQQTDPEFEKLDDYKASSYINYQGSKLVNRFNAYSYWLLTKSMDSHHLARGRGGHVEQVLAGMEQKTMIVGINSDILCPVAEQEFLTRHIPNASLVIIDSDYGHDGFMVESTIISGHLAKWMNAIAS